MLTETPVSPDWAPARDARPTPQERKAAGKAVRTAVPLDAHAESPRATRSRDPLTLLEEQAVDRLPELRPIRYGRMLQSPFAYYRGAARVMAADLAGAPRSGLTVQMCGDAHAANFGLYGSPSTRPCPDPSSTTSSDWSPAWRSPAGTTACPGSSGAASPSRPARATGPRWRGSRLPGTSRSGTRG